MPEGTTVRVALMGDEESPGQPIDAHPRRRPGRIAGAALGHREPGPVPGRNRRRVRLGGELGSGGGEVQRRREGRDREGRPALPPRRPQQGYHRRRVQRRGRSCLPE
jgi:hypothetical protein